MGLHIHDHNICQQWGHHYVWLFIQYYKTTMPYPSSYNATQTMYPTIVYSMLYVTYYMKSADVFYYFSHIDVIVCDESRSCIHFVLYRVTRYTFNPASLLALSPAPPSFSMFHTEKRFSAWNIESWEGLGTRLPLCGKTVLITSITMSLKHKLQ